MDVKSLVRPVGAPMPVFRCYLELVARHFHRARRDDVRSLLDTLDALGLVEKQGEDAYAV